MEHLSFRRNGKEFEPTKAELKMVLDDFAQRLAILEKALELACEELMEDLTFESEDDKHYTLQENIEYFKTKAKEMMKSE